MSSIITQIIRQRADIESELIHIKRICSPQSSDNRSEVEQKLTYLNKLQTDLTIKVQELKEEIEKIEKTNSNVNKSSLTRVYGDLKQLENNINKVALNTSNSLRHKMQHIDLVSTSNQAVTMDEEQSSTYSHLREQDDLVNQGNRKADAALSMGRDVLSMFNNQNQKMKRIFGNLKDLGADARYSDWLAGGIVRRIASDKRLFYVLAIASMLIIVTIYWLFKRK